MDYGLFSAPGNLTKSQIDIVGTKLMSILGDDVDRDLKTPKWILYKDYNFLVWGLCCENRLLALNPQETTHKNRPVRGFSPHIAERRNIRYSGQDSAAILRCILLSVILSDAALL